MMTIDLDCLDDVTGGADAAAAAQAPVVSDAELTRNNDLTNAANAKWQKMSLGFCGEFFSKASELAASDPNVAKLQAKTGIECLGGLPQ